MLVWVRVCVSWVMIDNGFIPWVIVAKIQEMLLRGGTPQQPFRMGIDTPIFSSLRVGVD